jgi:hypothetical protein
MIIKDILKETTAIVCGRIDQKENNVEKMLGMMEYNFPVLDACHSVVLVLNRGSDVSEKEITEIADAYKSKFKILYITAASCWYGASSWSRNIRQDRIFVCQKQSWHQIYNEDV